MDKQELRNRVVSILGKTGIDTADMSGQDLQKLIYRVEAHQIELEVRIEELQKTQQDLLESRNYYARIYEYAPVGFMVLNKKGDIVEANMAAAFLLNCSRSSLLDTPLATFIHPDDQEKYYLSHNKMIISHDLQVTELKVRKPNSDFFYVQMQGHSIYSDNNDIKTLITLVDINQPKQTAETILNKNKDLEYKVNSQARELIIANRNLQQKEARLNSIVSAAVEGIISINDTGIIEYVNEAVTTLLGYDKEELIGCNVNKIIPGPHKNRHDQYLKNYLTTGIAKIIGQIREVEAKHKNGRIVPIDISVAEFEIDHSKFFTAMLRDVSDRKHKEQKDKGHLEELAHVTRLGMMGEMASGLAHEINQPLTAITAYIQVCLSLIKNDDVEPDKLVETLEKIQQQAMLAGRIIHSMRDLVTPNKKHRAMIEVNPLIQEAADFCRADCNRYAIKLKLELTESLPNIYVDSVQIKQVLLNLIRNSIEAMQNLSWKTQKQLHIQSYLINDRQVEVRVKDNGPGIDAAEQNQVFKPFYSTKPSGMGMGLSISRSIVEAHDGSLSINNKKGKGTTFYMTLPVPEELNEN